MLFLIPCANTVPGITCRLGTFLVFGTLMFRLMRQTPKNKQSDKSHSSMCLEPDTPLSPTATARSIPAPVGPPPYISNRPTNHHPDLSHRTSSSPAASRNHKQSGIVQHGPDDCVAPENVHAIVSIASQYRKSLGVGLLYDLESR